ncbi:MAG TPA: hypothetical protein V6D47_14730 [Oscillatoriaceae cyanobacterium]
MIVAFDPVSKELIIDPENGLEPLAISAIGLEARYYADDGMFSVLLGERSLDIRFIPAPDGRFRARADVLDPNHWLVRIEEEPGADAPGSKN